MGLGFVENIPLLWVWYAVAHFFLANPLVWIGRDSAFVVASVNTAAKACRPAAQNLAATGRWQEVAGHISRPTTRRT